jgi:hypothetical protein
VRPSPQWELAIRQKFLRAAIPHHPLEVLDYAMRHSYVDIMDEAAWDSIGCGLDEGAMHLSADVLAVWV